MQFRGILFYLKITTGAKMTPVVSFTKDQGGIVQKL